MVKWNDIEKNTPQNDGYYLCQIWVASVNQYGNLTEYRVAYYYEEFTGFMGYPVIERGPDGSVYEYRRITWWAEIDEPPINLEHHKVPEQDIKDKE